MYKSVRVTSNKTTVKEWSDMGKAVAYAKRWSHTANHVLTEVYNENMELLFTTEQLLSDDKAPEILELSKEDEKGIERKNNVVYAIDKKYAVTFETTVNADKDTAIAFVMKAAGAYLGKKGYTFAKENFNKFMNLGLAIYEQEFLDALEAYHNKFYDENGIALIEVTALTDATRTYAYTVRLKVQKVSTKQQVAETKAKSAVAEIATAYEPMTAKERLADYGASALTNAELLSLLVHVPSKNFNNDLAATLANPALFVKGIGKKKSETFACIREIAKRLQKATTQNLVQIKGPKDVAELLMPDYQHKQQEHFLVLCLNTKNRVTHISEVSIGDISAAIVSPRDCFFEAIKYHAASLIVAHNHPSGDPSPSREDVKVTERLVKAGKIMDIHVLDHVIIGDNDFFSMKSRCLM